MCKYHSYGSGGGGGDYCVVLKTDLSGFVEAFIRFPVFTPNVHSLVPSHTSLH